jgi:hypothetical protein
MKKLVLVQSAVMAALISVLILVAFNSATDVGATVAYAQGSGDEVPPSGHSTDRPTAPAVPETVPTTLVYFNPQDNDANATVIVLPNSANVTQTVVVRGYAANSGPFGVWNVAVGPYGLVHLVSDSLAASPPPSWANSVVTNFTDFTTYATLEVPQGVKIDGYLVFNPGTGTVDPRLDQGSIPLRFSTDPLTVFLPSVNR